MPSSVRWLMHWGTIVRDNEQCLELIRRAHCCAILKIVRVSDGALYTWWSQRDHNDCDSQPWFSEILYWFLLNLATIMEVGRCVDVKQNWMSYWRTSSVGVGLNQKTTRDIFFPCAWMNVHSSFVGKSFLFLEQRPTGIPAFSVTI